MHFVQKQYKTDTFDTIRQRIIISKMMDIASNCGTIELKMTVFVILHSSQTHAQKHGPLFISSCFNGTLSLQHVAYRDFNLKIGDAVVGR
jgi:hypothetical protein